MVSVESRLEPIPVAAALIEAAAGETLRHEGAEGGLTILLSDDEEVRALNHQYLGVDSSTDVLSFPAGETDPDLAETYLGDVIISVPQARLQAKAAGHPVESEVQLLVVHGVLHLLGHDHAEAGGKARMWKAQAAVLQRLGLEGIVVRE